MFIPLDSQFGTKKLFSLGILWERILFQNSKCQRWKKNIVQPQVVLPIKAWFLHSTLDMSKFLRGSYLFRSNIG